MPRITSKETYVEFKVGRTSAETTQVDHLYMHADVSGGTFKLRVNGYLTGSIAWNATIGTMVASINSALDAVLGSGVLVATASAQTDITLTGGATGYFRVSLHPDSQALTGNATTADDLTRETTTVGGVWTALSADMSEFQYEESAETTDVTGLSEEEQEVLVTKSSCSYSLSLYEANQAWAYMIHQGVEGRMRVYNQGKVAGKKYLEMECLIESVSGNTPDHDVLEKEVSGMRQGAWIAPPDSIY